MSKYNFTVQLKTEKGGKIEIDPAAMYGYWEWPSGVEGGGLWFETHESSTPGDAGRKLELMDADGHWELPKQFVDCLRANGYVLNSDWD